MGHLDRSPLVKLPGVLMPGSSPTAASARPGARYLMGIDGGATKTLAAVLDLHERRVWLGHAGSSNPDAVGAEVATEALVTSADRALRAGGITRAQLDQVVVAVAGTDTAAVAERLGDVRTSCWIVVNDVVGAWATATAGKPGVAVISGTGSNVFGVGRDAGRSWRAGGWGHVLGDEGSGYWLGVESIKSALRDRESSGPATALSAAIVAHLGLDHVEDVASLVYSGPVDKGQIASLATVTARVAADGDEVAIDLYRRGAGELASQVAAVIARTELSGPFPVGLIGSVFKVGDLFVAPLTDAIARISAQARVAVVQIAPVAGSLLLSARAAGESDRLDWAQLTEMIDDALHTTDASHTDASHTDAS